MARSSATGIFLLLLFTTIALATAVDPSRFLQSEQIVTKKNFRREKLSHFRFYWHDVVSGSNPTAVQVARAAMTNTSRTGFGAVVMIDDMLTERPETTSRLVGRAQGLYASASQEVVGLIMAMNFAFSEGKYNGSTVAILGRNTVFSEVREMPVVGGSGLFRFARGYAQARTHSFDLNTGDAVVEYNLFVIHY